MNTNEMVSLLLGNTFPITGNIGNIVEVMLGGTVNCFGKADLGFWEVKTRMNGARAYMSLGSKDSTIEILAEQVFNKIKNVFFVEYTVNDDKTFTVTKITLLQDLDHDKFVNGYNKIWKVEIRSDQMKVIKISQKNFLKMYEKTP